MTQPSSAPPPGEATNTTRPSPSLPRGKTHVSIRDVAALAGVSIGTVSNTINRPDRVRRPTREAVERAIDELGFIPNQQARVLTGASSQVIGLVVLDIVNPFFTAAARAVEQAASEAGHVVILCNSENDPHKQTQLLDMLAAQRVRGALLTPASTTEHAGAEEFHDDRLPIVFLDFENTADDCSVSVDDISGARAAVRHLLGHGRDRIAFVGGPPGLRQMIQRSEGARQAIIAAGLDPTSSLVEVSSPGLGIQDGVAAAEKLLAGTLPTGIFCGNDMIAFGVYRGLAKAGVRIPEDVALVGYDDIDFAADWIVPLTSVRQPVDELGYRAAQLLFEHSSPDTSHVHQQYVLAPDLIVRASSDPGAR